MAVSGRRGGGGRRGARVRLPATRARRLVPAAVVAFALGAPSIARGQEEPPPPPPPGPREAEPLPDRPREGLQKIQLGDLSTREDDPAGEETVIVAVGGMSQPVRLVYPDFELRCDSAVIWGDRARLVAAVDDPDSVDANGTDDLLGNVFHAVYAEGNVFVRRDRHEFHADRVLLDFRTHHAYLVDVLMQSRGEAVRAGREAPLTLRAAIVRGVAKDVYRAEDATFSSCTYEHPHLAFVTDWVEVDFSKRQPEFETSWWPTVRAETVVGEVPLLPVPKLGGTLGTHPVERFEFSNSNRFGTTAGIGFGGRLDREDGSTWGDWQVRPRYRTRRGAGVGVELDHTALPDRRGGPEDRLTVELEYQRDDKSEDAFSDRPFDGLPGGESQEDRGRADVRYRRWLDGGERALLGEGWRLDTAASWYSDRGYLPEYDSDAALRDDQRETYAQLRGAWGNQAVSVLGSYRLADETAALVRLPTDPFRTDYAVATDHLPTAVWHLMNEPVVPYGATGFAPLNLSVEAAVSRVNRRHDDVVADALHRAGWRSEDVLREDLEGRLTAPFEVGPFQVTPSAGGSLYRVERANGFDHAGTDAAEEPEGRGTAHAGLRVGSEAHRDFDVRRPALGLDGLRHVVSADAQWFDRFHVSDPGSGEFQQNDLRDALEEENVLSFRLRNRLQTRRDGEVVDWADYEARLLYYVDESRRRRFTGLGLREDFAAPLDRIDFPGEEKYQTRVREGSAFHQHRARLEVLPEVWLVGEADHDMTASRTESTAGGVRWIPDPRLGLYVGRRTIHEDSEIWTVRADYRLSEKWGFSGEFQEDTRSNRGLRTRLGLFRRSHDFTVAIEFESERLLDETGVSLVVYPHDWISRRHDPFSQRRALDFEALRWYR